MNRLYLFDAWQESPDHARPAGVPQLVKHEFLQVFVDVEHTLDVHVGLRKGQTTSKYNTFGSFG